MFWIKIIKKVIKALNANVSPSELAGGILLGAGLGLIPGFKLHELLIIALLIVLRVNVGAAIIFAPLFAIAGYFLDPVSGALGYSLLTMDALQGLWTTLYNIPLVPFTGFNNTVTLGSTLIYTVMAAPLYLFLKKAVILYRKKILPLLEKLKIFKILKASKLYSVYDRYRG